MATKQKAIKVCNTCGKEIPERSGFYCDDVQYEGYSTISHGKESFAVTDEKDYCSFDCLVADIKKDLKC